MLDRERGLVTVEAGIEWPDLIAELERLQPHARATDPAPWSIVQKQTGADRLTLGGALAANIHGRGLQLAPIVSNVESFLLVDADGEMRTCSRTENVELFRGAIGGYGLLGVIAAVTLRLQRRYQIIRRVEIRDTHGLIDAFNRRIAEDCTFGDFQFATDATHDSFLRTGVFSCYQRVDALDDAVRVLASTNQRALSPEDWRRLAYLAHVDKSRAFEMYARHYLSTEGQVYWSDTHQLAFYEPDYHAHLDTQPGVAPGTEMITEIYVPRAALEAYLEDARRLLRERHADLIYGTIRLIERDDETRAGVGARAVGVHHLQSARDAYRRRDRSQRRYVPRPDRSRDRARRQLLPDVSPLGHARAAAPLSPALRRVRRAQAAGRSAVALPERLVSALRRDRTTRTTPMRPASAANGQRCVRQLQMKKMAMPSSSVPRPNAMTSGSEVANRKIHPNSAIAFGIG